MPAFPKSSQTELVPLWSTDFPPPGPLSEILLGIADVAFIGAQMFALTAGGGCSHGHPNAPNSILKVNSDGTWSRLADLSAFQKLHPTKTIEPDDFEPDGTWYSLIAADGVLYAVEPNHGEV